MMGGACSAKSLGRCGQPVEERLPHGGGSVAVEALEHHGDAQDVVAAEGDLLAPLRIEELLAVEGDEALDQLAVGGIGLGSHVHEHGAEELGQLARPEREPRDDAEAAAAAALQGPEQVRVGAGVGDAHRAVGRHHLGLDQAGGGHAVALGEGAEAAALDQAGHAHRGAAAALHVAAGLGDRVVGVQPHHAGTQRHRRLRAIAAALADKGVVQLDAVHGARPHQQRIGCVGRPLIGVAAALHGEPQAMGAREVDRGRDVGRIARGHGIGAGGRRPGIGPAAGLGQGNAVADQPGVLQAFEEGGALGTGRRGAAGIERRLDLDELAAHLGVQLLPLAGRRPGRISGTAAALGRSWA